METERAGFSLVEVVMALVILSVGLLAMGAATGYVSTQTRISEVRTERTLVRQYVTEQLRATPFDSIKDRTYDQATVVEGYRVWWDVNRPEFHLKRVLLYTEGRGRRPVEGWVDDAQDTLALSITRGGG